MNSDEFVKEIAALQEKHRLTDDQVASGLIGIVIELCRRNDNDPLSFMQWALRATTAHRRESRLQRFKRWLDEGVRF